MEDVPPSPPSSPFQISTRTFHSAKPKACRFFSSIAELRSGSSPRRGPLTLSRPFIKTRQRRGDLCRSYDYAPTYPPATTQMLTRPPIYHFVRRRVKPSSPSEGDKQTSSSNHDHSRSTCATLCARLIVLPLSFSFFLSGYECVDVEFMRSLLPFHSYLRSCMRTSERTRVEILQHEPTNSLLLPRANQQ